VLLAGFIYLLADKFWFSRHHEQPVASSLAAEPPAASSPSRVEAPAPPHSIAVLPFVNMSGDPKEDYFSDGLSEELLNSLAAIPELKVAARTSSFSFKGKNADVADIARKLNVGAVLEGSVRKDGNEVRITAQLINASTGYHLWSHIYDRNLKNILALQTEIATAVTQALQATLMANAAASIELGGTHNPVAFDAYLRGENLRLTTSDKEHEQQAIADFEEAVRLDPDFAKGYAGLARAQSALVAEYLTADEARLLLSHARTNAERAIALAPELGIAHSALGSVLEGTLDFAGAQHAYEQALELSPNDAGVLLRAGVFWVRMGRTEAGLADAQKAVTLDPLSANAYSRLAIALQDGRRYRESIEAGKRALDINRTDMDTKHALGLSQLLAGDPAAARATCETTPRTWLAYLCLAILYHRIQRQHEAEGELAALRAQFQATASYQYAEIYAQWGDIPRALDALDTAYRVCDPGIADLKVDELLEPLRHEPRFQAIEQKLNFPK
jgi:serine/threonine-protein kinase